jgi:hypothetical protein
MLKKIADVWARLTAPHEESVYRAGILADLAARNTYGKSELEKMCLRLQYLMAKSDAIEAAERHQRALAEYDATLARSAR